MGPPGFEPGGGGKSVSSFGWLRDRIRLGDKLATSQCGLADARASHRSGRRRARVLTDVGAYALSAGLSHTFDQGGNGCGANPSACPSAVAGRRLGDRARPGKRSGACLRGLAPPNVRPTLWLQATRLLNRLGAGPCGYGGLVASFTPFRTRDCRTGTSAQSRRHNARRVRSA